MTARAYPARKVAKPKRRVAWLVVVERTGECIDAGPARKQARVSARDLTDAMEPCKVLRVEYDWPVFASSGRRKGRK